MSKKTPPDADCAKAIASAAGGKLTDDEVTDAHSRIADHKRALIAAGKTDNMAERLAAFAEREAERVRIAAAMQRRHAGLNIAARDRLDQQIKTFMDAGMTPREALLALTEGSQKAVAGARASVDATKLAYEARYLGGVMSELQREVPYFNKLLNDDAFDADVTREMAELREGGSPGATGNNDAQKVARIFATHAELSRTEANRLGASIGKLDGWAGPQMHDDLKLLAAGKDNWVSGILPRLDLARTFPDVDEEQAVRDALGDIWDTLIVGIPSRPSARLRGERVNPANLAKTLGASRVLHFKDADAALAYRGEFGFGNTSSGIIAHLRRVASVNAQMQAFGPNPEVMLGSIVERLKLDIKHAPVSEADRAVRVARFDREIADLNADQDLSEIERENAVARATAKREAAKTSRLFPDADKAKFIGQLEFDDGRLKHAFDVMSGVVTRPVNVTAAKINADVRSTQNMAKLGGAIFSALFSDPVTAAIASQVRGSGFFNGLVKQTGGLIRGRPKGEQAEIAYLCGEGFDGLTGHISSAAAATDGPVGALSRLQEIFFRWNLLTPYTDAGRATAGKVISAEMGMHSKTSYDALPRAYRDLLAAHSITPQKWDAIRQAKFRASNGNLYVTPDRLADLADDVIEPLVAKRIAAARKASRVDQAKSDEVRAERLAKFEEQRSKILQDGRRELQLDVLGFVADETNYAVLEVDARSRRTTSLGSRPGTWSGEAIRYVMQFKGFPIAFTHRVLGRAYQHARRSDVGVGEKAMHIGTLIAGTTVAGYMGLVMKDLMRGYWPPRDPTKPETWGAALVQGGGVGIYGDFLFGEANRFGGGVLETLAGPTPGAAANLIELYQKSKDAALSEDKKVKAADYLTAAVNNMAGLNLFYVRPALDYLILNDMREATSPGYLARTERRRMRDYEQYSIYPRAVQAGR